MGTPRQMARPGVVFTKLLPMLEKCRPYSVNMVWGYMKSVLAVFLAVTLVAGLATSASARRIMDVSATASLAFQDSNHGPARTRALAADEGRSNRTDAPMPGCTSKSLCNLTSGAGCCSCAIGQGASFGPALSGCTSAVFSAFVDDPDGVSPVSLLKPPRL